ncbi:MAG: hypothetical protein GYB67_09055 [Chloroflexi bacterium]|nr:hypothetical protein [Chloroflexota bacterium]
MKRLHALAFLTGFVLLLTATLVVAQNTYQAGPLAALIRAEQQSQVTLAVECTVNNVRTNVLNIGNSPSGRVDANGFNVVEVPRIQSTLPIVCSLPPGLFSSIALELENTDFTWFVKVEPTGLFLTEFPTSLFPPAEYYMTLNGVRLFRVDIQ